MINSFNKINSFSVRYFELILNIERGFNNVQRFLIFKFQNHKDSKIGKNSPNVAFLSGIHR